uniref:RAP domain-containing protein n=1 Tax=Neospora caninum (strain Liverpool) TaxID=572307 RepID=A0A0F7UI44_NEOCL|nr:TPA: RAP domain-containing protein [Neospora caninum Liverpool]
MKLRPKLSRRLEAAVQTPLPFRRTVRYGHRQNGCCPTPFFPDAGFAFLPTDRAAESRVSAQDDAPSSAAFEDWSKPPGGRKTAWRLQDAPGISRSRPSSELNSHGLYSSCWPGVTGNNAGSFSRSSVQLWASRFAKDRRFPRSRCLHTGRCHVEPSRRGGGGETECVPVSSSGDCTRVEERRADGDTELLTGPEKEIDIDMRFFDGSVYSEEEDLLEKKRRIGVGMGPGGSAPSRGAPPASGSSPGSFRSSCGRGVFVSSPTSSQAGLLSESLPRAPSCSPPLAPPPFSPSSLSSPKLVPVSEYCKLSRRFPPGQEAVGAFDLAVKFETLVSLRFPLDQHPRRTHACFPRSRLASMPSRPRPPASLPSPAAFQQLLGEAISIAKANADILPVSTLLSVAHAAARLGVQIFSFASALRRRALDLLPEIKNPAAFIRLLQDLEKLGGLGDRHFIFFREKVKETLQSASSRCSLFGTTLVVHLLARHRLRDEELLTLAYRRFSRNRYTLAAAVRETPSLLAALPLALSRLEVPTLAASVLDSLLRDQARATLSQLSIHELSNLAYAIACVSTHSQVTVGTRASTDDAGSCHAERLERFVRDPPKSSGKLGCDMQLQPEQRPASKQAGNAFVDSTESNAASRGIGGQAPENQRGKDTSFQVLETRAVCTPEELGRRSALLTTILRTLSRSSLRRQPLNSPFERAWRQMQIIDLHLQYKIGPLCVDDEEALQFLSLAREKKLLNLVHVSQVQKRVGRLLFDEGLMSEICVEYPLGPYVLDFAIPSRKLVVEVDGEAHFFFGTTVPTAQTRMKRELLAAMGWHVVVVPQELWRNKRKGKIKEFVARKVREGLEIDSGGR